MESPAPTPGPITQVTAVMAFVKPPEGISVRLVAPPMYVKGAKHGYPPKRMTGVRSGGSLFTRFVPVTVSVNPPWVGAEPDAGHPTTEDGAGVEKVDVRVIVNAKLVAPPPEFLEFEYNASEFKAPGAALMFHAVHTIMVSLTIYTSSQFVPAAVGTSKVGKYLETVACPTR